jgi:hypothetical protein
MINFIYIIFIVVVIIIIFSNAEISLPFSQQAILNIPAKKNRKKKKKKKGKRKKEKENYLVTKQHPFSTFVRSQKQPFYNTEKHIIPL